MEPLYFSVVGSHAFGVSDEASDIDVFGVHCVSGQEYWRLNTPASHYKTKGSINLKGGLGTPFELTSYELKQFGQLLASPDIHAIEMVMSGQILLNNITTAIERLCSIITGNLPLTLHVRYQSMAREVSNEIRRSESASSKDYLHALRGALVAHHLIDTGEFQIEPRTLSKHVLGETNLVDQLIFQKRMREDLSTADPLAKATFDQIDALLEKDGPTTSEPDLDSYRAAIDRWMLNIRNKRC